jgi:predicted dehydrogenase
MTAAGAHSAPRAARARLGFLGTGWIGRHRLAALAASGCAEVAAVSDPDGAACAAALAAAPGARAMTFADMLAEGLDGVVIATPSALHAEQSLRALEAGVAVFCQKPLGRTAAEVEAVVRAAARADRPLGVDLVYRHTAAVVAVARLVRTGALGSVYAFDLVFHNAYGPDKPWFRDPVRSGGGCVIDLGIHFVDLALWLVGSRAVPDVRARLFACGRPLAGRAVVEDHSEVQLDLAPGGAAPDGAVARVACSWNLPAGQDAVIRCAVYGTDGGAVVENVGGSFYDFVAARFRGTAREVLTAPPDDWGGRALVAWARRVAAGEGFEEDGTLVTVARALDRIYGRGERRDGGP